MPNIRKPAPRKTPTLLRELVRDLDDRLEGGDALSDVWMPHEEWARLVEQADEEALTAAAETGAKKRAEKSDAEVIRILEAGHEETRKLLAKSLGAGVDSSWGELFEVARGYVMALDAERERFVRRVGEVLAVSRSAENAPTGVCGAGEEKELEHPECPHCGEADGHKPADCAMKETEEEPKPTAKRGRKKKAAMLDEPAPGVAERPLRPRKVRIQDEAAQAEVLF